MTFAAWVAMVAAPEIGPEKNTLYKYSQGCEICPIQYGLDFVGSEDATAKKLQLLVFHFARKCL